MKYKIFILLFLILIFLTFSCKQIFKKIFIKSYNTEANIEIILNSNNNDIVNKLTNILNYRFNKYLINAKYDFSDISKNKLLINVTNFKNLQEIKSLLENQGKFEIMTLTDDGKEKELFFIDDNDTFVEGAYVENNNNKLSLIFTLKENYINKFAEFTENNIGQLILFKLDNAILFRPVIQEKIPNGKVQLTIQNATVDELLLYEVLLLSGKLPINLNKKNMKIIEKAVQTGR